jgi:hypothetical protein
MILSVFALQLQRAWRSLRWDERCRFAITLLQGMSDINLDVSEESLQVTSIIAFKATILTEKSRY